MNNWDRYFLFLLAVLCTSIVTLIAYAVAQVLLGNGS